KLAITADLHLTSHQEHPERFHALDNILEQMLSARIDKIIIAGDLFDEGSRNYAEFDNFCKNPKYQRIQFLLIPGNHDARLNNQSVTAENVEIITEPKILTFDSNGLKFIFLPYKKDRTMGEEISGLASQLTPNDWVLIGHGDWSEGLQEPNPMEPGVYMPLTRTDLENFKPAQVVLGHIHKAMDSGSVHYVGSPCGLDITETGRRRFLVIDAESGTIKPQIVDSDFIFFNESLIILPLPDESAYIKEQIEAKIKNWGLKESEKSKVRLQFKVRGYTSNKRTLLETVEECLREYDFYQNRQPDISEVSISDDIERAEIAHRAAEWIKKLDWAINHEQPDKDQILLQALHVIYGD
ncbi:MAG: exonuclease SbcCD subunit D, partial [bacterium]